MRYLLDTNIVSDLVRNPQGPIAARIAQVGEGAICTSIIVAAELRFGAAKKGSPRLTAQLQAVLAALEVLPFEAPADVAYGQLRARLEAAGTPIGGNDMLIAAHAISSGCSVVTDNEREFGRVDGLTVVNWLR
ncbi:type II toxin-antitoxin system VapC family toxin [Phenylobacterium sp.]|uniref:type II toxin-antitoxin system VapC family toxin n=1 Tax=Phenylobacterium sp. TaxID=1871053 RepID=UPI0027183DDD|nr:type II toxin-antitoxin system VapC family toxin [Phenylobacterium sp.]MDO8378567.1 type II toxin-antitoxin system VapC family toxin [Phenylobacterium sp.]